MKIARVAAWKGDLNVIKNLFRQTYMGGINFCNPL
jgi:hypothetical protein